MKKINIVDQIIQNNYQSRNNVLIEDALLFVKDRFENFYKTLTLIRWQVNLVGDESTNSQTNDFTIEIMQQTLINQVSFELDQNEGTFRLSVQEILDQIQDHEKKSFNLKELTIWLIQQLIQIAEHEGTEKSKIDEARIQFTLLPIKILRSKSYILIDF